MVVQKGLLYTLFIARILKDAMRTGGANNTPQHIEDLSLCGLFFLKVCKKIDREFGAHRSTAHTTPDAYRDISKIVEHLLQTKVVEKKDRESPVFIDPTNAGLDKLCNSSWVRDILSRGGDTEDLQEEEAQDHGTIDLNYELHDVV